MCIVVVPVCKYCNAAATLEHHTLLPRSDLFLENYLLHKQTALKKRTAEARRAQSFRDYQRKIFAFSADYQSLSAVKISFFSGLTSKHLENNNYLCCHLVEYLSIAAGC